MQKYQILTKKIVILFSGSVFFLLSDTALALNALEGIAVLDAATFAEGPTSGTLIGNSPINGQQVPFINKQPVQGFSAIINNQDGSFLVMSDNGFGSMENSSDYHLRCYTIRPDFKTVSGGSGSIAVENFIELHDPDGQIPFVIVNSLTQTRILTGADFDIESIQKALDGTLWFGDEFGPFLLHTDAEGKVLEAPIPLPDFDNYGREIKSPQNPYNEESNAVRIMNAVRAHAQINGNNKAPVFSPWHVMLDDGNPETFVSSRQNPPQTSGLAKASSELFNVNSLHRAGYPVVVWTVNDLERMEELINLGVDGIISDRPDLLLQAIMNYDADQDGNPDLLDEEGLIDISRFDAQGHRGGRNLRPENTLPAMEAALDNLMTTLEADTGITIDGIPVLSHDPYIEAPKSRKADGSDYEYEDEVLISNLTADEIHSLFICDKLLPGRHDQTNDPGLSPVSVAFAEAKDLIDPYLMPSLQQLFDFVAFYAEYYHAGEGSSHPEAAKRWKNAQRVRFNIETKTNPRSDADSKGKVFSERTVDPEPFARAVANLIIFNGLENRAYIQSFDFRTLLTVQEEFPNIKTVYLFGDFPKVGNSGDGTNLQDENRSNTPWMAGLFWPYRITAYDHPFRAQRSGGFEGMALTSDGKNLLPLLEKPLRGGKRNTLLIHKFDLSGKKYTGARYEYRLNPRGNAIGDFIMYDATGGLVIERDGSQANLNGFKAIYKIELNGINIPVKKIRLVNLLRIIDKDRITKDQGPEGDVGLADKGVRFAFPFVTIEDVVVLDNYHIGVLNDNNYPFSIGRHPGSGLPDDNEFIKIKLQRPLRR